MLLKQIQETTDLYEQKRSLRMIYLMIFNESQEHNINLNMLYCALITEVISEKGEKYYNYYDIK